MAASSTWAAWELWYEARDWARVAATIQECRAGNGSAPRRRQPTQIEYVYEYKGHTYQGSRLLPGKGTATASELSGPRQALLRDRAASGEPLRAWVNPAHPSQSLLFRTLPTDLWMWGGLCGLIGLCGLGVLGAGGWSIRRALRRRRLAARFPDKPWRSEGGWEQLKSHSEGASALVTQWALCLFGTVFSGFCFWVAYTGGTETGWLLIVGAICAVCLIGVSLSVYKTMLYWKWGRATLVFPRIPFRPGGVLEAEIRCGRLLRPTGDVRLTLLCSKDVKVKKRGDFRLKRRNLLEQTLTVQKESLDSPGPEGTVVPVRMDIPAGYPGTRRMDEVVTLATSGSTKELQTYWELEVEVPCPGLDFYAVFLVPVYEVEDSSVVEYREGAS